MSSFIPFMYLYTFIPLAQEKLNAIWHNNLVYYTRDYIISNKDKTRICLKCIAVHICVPKREFIKGIILDWFILSIYLDSPLLCQCAGVLSSQRTPRDYISWTITSILWNFDNLSLIGVLYILIIYSLKYSATKKYLHIWIEFILYMLPISIHSMLPKISILDGLFRAGPELLL